MLIIFSCIIYNTHIGPQAQQLAEILLTSAQIHVIGSDAHRVSRSESTYSEGLQSIKEIVGETRYPQLTGRNPQTILEGNFLQVDRDYCVNGPISKKRHNRFWNVFRR